jgi:hypothetical protein
MLVITHPDDGQFGVIEQSLTSRMPRQGVSRKRLAASAPRSRRFSHFVLQMAVAVIAS